MMVTLCILGLISPSQGQPPTCNIIVFPSARDIDVSSVFIIDIVIKDLTNPMTSFYFVVRWDSNLMELMESEERCLANGWSTFFPGDSASVYYLEASGPPFGSDTSWVTLRFHCKGEGSSDIEFITYFVKVDDTEFDVTVEGGAVSQFAPVLPVGGIYAPMNRLNILVPYFALIGLIGVFSTILVNRKWHKS